MLLHSKNEGRSILLESLAQSTARLPRACPTRVPYSAGPERADATESVLVLRCSLLQVRLHGFDLVGLADEALLELFFELEAVGDRALPGFLNESLRGSDRVG